jgi:hypothetical protein
MEVSKNKKTRTRTDDSSEEILNKRKRKLCGSPRSRVVCKSQFENMVCNSENTRTQEQE